jgi:hypothetical protein
MNVKDLHIHKYKYWSNKTTKKKTIKVIAFDLDETIGSFTHFTMLWNALPINRNQIIFNKLLDIFPEFLRYNILSILQFLYKRKQVHDFEKLYIYTNNQYSPEFPNYVVEYLQSKMLPINLTVKLFDKVIGAYKINDKIIEPNRSSNTKQFDDFIRCSMIPKISEICFIDDHYYEKMKRKQIYYIQPKPYFHDLKMNDIRERFSNFLDLEIYTDSGFLEKYFTTSTVEEIMKKFDKIFIHIPEFMIMHYDKTVEHIISQKMMYHIKEFLYASRNAKTKKIKFNLGNFTRKK